jgi:glycosyltransferase involved in cell wall biosynthesis
MNGTSNVTPLRCLWVTRLVPYPPFVGGDATYSSRLIESLASAGVEVTVLAHDNGGPPPPLTRGVEWVVVPFRDRGRFRSIFGRMPALVYRFSTPQVRHALGTLLSERSWDALLIDNMAMAGVVDLRDGDRSTPLVYVSHNHEESIREQLAARTPRRSPKRFALRWDAMKSAPLERSLVDAADLVTVNTSDDADLYRRHAPDQRYLVLTPGYDGSAVVARVIDAETPRRITLLGSYAWIAKQLNLWRFLEAGADRLARAGIGIDVVGSAPDDFADRLRASFPDVTVTGPVDRVEPYLARARMGIVAEEIGGGFKHKVLHYVFNRLPVASLAGSVAGTPLVPGESILEFADMDSLVGGIIGSIDDLTKLNAVQEAAFSATDGQFGWAERGMALAESLALLGEPEATGA